MTYWPDLKFAKYVGPSERWFAWKPVKLWSGAWVWMRKVDRRVAVVKWHLTPSGGDSFWVYSKADKGA